MKRIIAVIVVLTGLGYSLNAQPKTVHFKKLQEFLPASIAGFERQKPTGRTQTIMGMSTSEASVSFTGTRKDTVTLSPEEGSGKQVQDIDVTFDITITDISLAPFLAAAYMMQTGDYENETEEGYEKSIMYKNYRGKESVTTTDYSKQCEVELLVGMKFMVKVRGSNMNELQVLRAILDGMKLEELEKTQP